MLARCCSVFIKKLLVNAHHISTEPCLRGYRFQKDHSGGREDNERRGKSCKWGELWRDKLENGLGEENGVYLRHFGDVALTNLGA